MNSKHSSFQLSCTINTQNVISLIKSLSVFCGIILKEILVLFTFLIQAASVENFLLLE